MNSGDTKYINLDKTLNAIGKAVFVQFYYDFKDTTISPDILIEKILRENPRSRSTKQGFRIPRAHHIFETGQEIDALKNIIASKKVDANTKILAEEILLKEERSKALSIDFQEEKEFNEMLDREIKYAEGTPFEYDNTPKSPSATSIVEMHRYPRSKTVAKNALRKAGYLCEVDNGHKLFKRKNSTVNYTEPHHIVPLYASADFPGVDLDREQNIVSLCSYCHNLLHYGADSEDVLKVIYDKRKDLLKQIGIDITLGQLKKYY